MRRIATLATMAAIVLAPALYAQTAPATSKAAAKPAAAAKNVATHSTNGTVKSVDATSLVISKPGSKSHDMTFALDPSTQKQGSIDVGSMVTVRYKTEGKTMTATAVTARPAKAAAKK